MSELGGRPGRRPRTGIESRDDDPPPLLPGRHGGGGEAEAMFRGAEPRVAQLHEA